MERERFEKRLSALPDGAYDVRFEGRRYLLRRESLLGERLVKCYAEELGGNGCVSFNFYPTLKLLKPCEIPAAKVIGFIEAAEPRRVNTACK